MKMVVDSDGIINQGRNSGNGHSASPNDNLQLGKKLVDLKVQLRKIKSGLVQLNRDVSSAQTKLNSAKLMQTRTLGRVNGFLEEKIDNGEEISHEMLLNEMDEIISLLTKKEDFLTDIRFKFSDLKVNLMTNFEEAKKSEKFSIKMNCQHLQPENVVLKVTRANRLYIKRTLDPSAIFDNGENEDQNNEARTWEFVYKLPAFEKESLKANIINGVLIIEGTKIVGDDVPKEEIETEKAEVVVPIEFLD